MVAPAYDSDVYVDHELSANLDSTFAFEGPEKLLEIWFWSSENSIPEGFSPEGLRCVPLEAWVKILDLVNCKILSMKSSKFMDAYLLSELSLFVFPHKLILKTCGTTTTLACLDQLFETVGRYVTKAAFSSFAIHRIFYSRRSFMFPDKQIHVHRDWKDEVKLLNGYFASGKSYVVGDFNSDDHWYLYMAGDHQDTDRTGASDLTFEILMTELDPVRAQHFVTDRKPGSESLKEGDLGHKYGMQTMATTTLDSVFEKSFSVSDIQNMSFHLPSPSSSDIEEEAAETGSVDRFAFIHDAFSFSPCGYSSNSISSNNGGYYYTLHVTPESGWSYASFETNYPFHKESDVTITDVLLKVLAIFKPGRFSVTLINEINARASGSPTKDSFVDLSKCDGVLAKLGYRKHEKIMYDLKSQYNLLYLNFER